MPSSLPFGAARLPLVQVVRARAPRRPRRRRRPPPAGSRCSSKRPSRSTLPLATQLSATPPARHRLRSPVSRATRARHAQHDLLGHLLDRGGDVHVELRQQLLRRARRLAEQRVELAVRHGQADAVVEVIQVQPERAVRLQVDQLVEDHAAHSAARRKARAPSACIRPS